MKSLKGRARCTLNSSLLTLLWIICIFFLNFLTSSPSVHLYIVWLLVTNVTAVNNFSSFMLRIKWNLCRYSSSLYFSVFTSASTCYKGEPLISLTFRAKKRKKRRKRKKLKMNMKELYQKKRKRKRVMMVITIRFVLNIWHLMNLYTDTRILLQWYLILHHMLVLLPNP